MKEIPWVDNIKGICIILVILYHYGIFIGYDASKWIYFIFPFFTNSFFFTSGYLIFRKQLNTEIIKKRLKEWINTDGIKMVKNIFYKLVIPSLIFSTLIYFSKTLIRNNGISLNAFIHDTILGGSLWFTSSLVIAELLVLFFLFIRTNKIIIYLCTASITCVIGLLLYYSSPSFIHNIPWFWNTGCVASLFLVFGGLLCTIEDYVDSITRGGNGRF